MKSIYITLAILLLSAFHPMPVSAQSNAYKGLIALAENAYSARHYDTAALLYSEAFQIEEGKGTTDDRYNAACCWARIGRADSAFYNLFCITQLADWSDYSHLIADADLVSLHSFKAWKVLCSEVRANMFKKDPVTDTPTAEALVWMNADDQQYRMRLGDIEAKYGRNSRESKIMWDTIRKYDAINLKKVKAMLNTHGWMSRRQIGRAGVTTVFLVLQHADSSTQIHYLPMLRTAAADNELPPEDLALFEDRVALSQGKKQIYGSQVFCDAAGCRIGKLEDPLHVDERRKSVHLGPLADYVREWHITWDAAAFAKKQAEEEAIAK